METDDPRSALDALVVARGESYAALSRMLRRNDAYLQQYVKRGTPRVLAEADRKLLAGYFRVDESVLGGPAGARAMPVAARVRRLDAAASAGPGALVEEDRLLGAALLDPALLLSLNLRAAHSAVLPARGDSMSPTIEDGDLMLIDESDHRVATRPAIFVIRFDGALMVKRLARSGEQLKITSDNVRFPPMPPALPDEVEILGRVVWLSRRLK